MAFEQADPAERGTLGFFYRNRRPTSFGRIWSQAYAWLSARGLTPKILLTLQVKDRRTGLPRSTVLAVCNHQGHQYLVSMLGDHSEWVQNLRAAHGQAFILQGRSRAARLVELAVEERAPVLKAWCQIAISGRKHLPVAYDQPVSAFAGIAADYPVFRIDPS